MRDQEQDDEEDFGQQLPYVELDEEMRVLNLDITFDGL